MVSQERLKRAREWARQQTDGFTHGDLVDQTWLTDGHGRTADRLLQALLEENSIERAYKLVEGRMQEYYVPFKITTENVLRIRARRDPHAALRLASIESPSHPPHPETLEKKKRILETAWHPAHEGAKYVHSALDCPAREKHRKKV